MFCLTLSLHQNVGSEVGRISLFTCSHSLAIGLVRSETSVLNRPFSSDGQRHVKLHLFKDALRVNTELLNVCLGPTWMKKVFFFKDSIFLC